MSTAHRPRGHENVATVLVDPAVLDDVELSLMADDFRVWLVETVSTFVDPKRLAFQVRQTLIEWSQGRWADAAEWTPIWITFGESWLDETDPAAPIPWAAHAALWDKLERYGSAVRYNRGLTGVPHLSVPSEADREADH